MGNEENNFQSLNVDILSPVAPAESDSAAKKQLYGSADISRGGVDLLHQGNPTTAASTNTFEEPDGGKAAWNLEIICRLCSRRNFSLSCQGHKHRK